MRKLLGAYTPLEERYRRSDAVLVEEQERMAAIAAKTAKLRAMREARVAGKLVPLPAPKIRETAQRRASIRVDELNASNDE